MVTPDPQPRLSHHLGSGKLTVVLNAASGSVGDDAVARIEAIGATLGRDIEARAVQPTDVPGALKAIVEERPEVLFVLAGDGTLALAAELCGLDGPLLAALPGGTMNMLPFALNGRRLWPEALTAILTTGQPMTVSGGEVGGRSFHVAAILGAAALWADAREAARHGRLRLALLRARRALSRAFKGRVRFTLNGGEKRKTEALSLMCPLVSRGLDEDIGLEAALLDPKGVLDIFRLGLRTLAGRWRTDPAVRTSVCTSGTAWMKGRIPAVIDGEPHRLDSPVSFRFKPAAFRALVPADSPALVGRSDGAEDGQADRPTQGRAAISAGADLR